MKFEGSVSRVELVECVNRWAQRRGATAVTERMLEDWNEEAIFPAGIPMAIPGQRTPGRRYTIEHLRRAILICLLKKKGIERYSHLRVMLWLHGAEIPGGPPRSDLVSEFDRLRKSILRPVRSHYDPALGFENKAKAATLLNQLGEQANVFRIGGLELDGAAALAAFASVYSGGGGPILGEMLVGLLSKLLPAVSTQDINELVPSDVFRGALGTGDEIDDSAISKLEKSTDSQLNVARRELIELQRQFPAVLRQLSEHPDLQRAFGVLPQLLNDPIWKLSIFVMIYSARSGEET